MKMADSVMRKRVQEAPVARLATVGEGLQPHLVPVVFAIQDETLWIAIDQKPKTTYDLKRLRNIRANPRVAVLIDHYEDDWAGLWWVRLDGPARVIEEGPQRETAISALQAKHEQHQADPPQGPVIEIHIEQWRGWSARPET